MFARARAGPRRPARHRLSVQPLEGRDVPAAPLATFAGTVDAPRQPAWAQMQVDTPDRVLLAFESTPADASAFVPGSLRVYAGPGAAGAARGAVEPGFSLKAVSGGMFFARAAAAAGSTGAFDVTVRLAGDVNGDQQVDATDLGVIRGLSGTRAGQDGFLPAADVNHNGIIGPGDVQLAQWNLGRTAAVGPLTAESFLLASSDDLQHGPLASVYNPKTMNGLSLVIDGINDSNSPIAVDGFRWSVKITPGSPAAVSDLSLSMKTSAASPKILEAAVKHTILKTVTLFAGRVGTQPRLRWDIDNVYVSSYQISGSSGGTPHLNDEVSLTFTRLHVTYVPTLPNGKPGTPVVFAYDFATGKGL